MATKRGRRKSVDCPPLPVKHFRLGQKVKMTQDAIDQGFQGRAKSTRGVVTRVDPRGWDVTVLRDGLKHATSYSVVFWQPAR